MTYIHHIPGRIRVRALALKREPARAGELRRWLEALPGVERVEISTVTGSVLIHYGPAAADGRTIIAQLRARGWIGGGGVRPRLAPVERAVGRMILGHLAEIAAERAVLAIAAAVL